jgi:hypothetical protein
MTQLHPQSDGSLAWGILNSCFELQIPSLGTNVRCLIIHKTGLNHLPSSKSIQHGLKSMPTYEDKLHA